VATSRRFFIVALLAAVACSQSGPRGGAMRASDRQAVADTIRKLMTNAYDLSKGDVVRRFMSLYPDSGQVVSAAVGTFTTSRDSLRRQVEAFWNGVGVLMQHPQWRWDSLVVDVLAPDAAAVTARYTVPHHTPDGAPHVIGGAWTSVGVNRGGRWQIVQEHLSDHPRPAAAALEAPMDSMPAVTPRPANPPR
jgi:hypothetical protein